MAKLFAHAREIAASMGVDLHEGQHGRWGPTATSPPPWVSPRSTASGPKARGAHAAHEHVLTESFPRRAALVAGLLLDG